ncbi:MAG: hypothetical protein KZQ99_16245, partial [Candidatus Thiodiazotropha sp. (ex Dulcina madagascariensis)]|nr:hypothetical protein [Candidatus Thiodiazotropha sp. (ex Dulcina madagascariensis)]
VGRLQRRFDALLQAGTLRLKVHYLVAGLIMRKDGLIDCFQQSRSRLTVNLNRAIDNILSHLIFYH